jgi:disulfide bond formation protein DsbB
MRLTQRGWLVAIAVLCLGAVGAALFTQYAWDMLPCPWCILQRLLFVVIAILALAGAFLPGRIVFAGLAALTAFGGIAAALYQHFVAAKSTSCNLTLADKIVGATGLDRALPYVFEVKASCADAAVNLGGMPYEFWSLGLFVVVVVLVLASFNAGQR